MTARRQKQNLRVASDFQVEPLESRVLFSADAALIASIDAAQSTDVVALVDSKSDSTKDAQNHVNDGSDVKLIENANELVVIDAASPDLDAFLADFAERKAPVQVVVLETGDDALSQLSKVLQQQKGLTALHLISHGADGMLELGGERVTTLDLLARANEISAWRNAFADDADWLIYGCDVAESNDGRAFVDTLARLTKTDVAASSDATGAAIHGGNWQLEYEHGTINSNVIASDVLQTGFNSTLATTYIVSNFADSGINTLRWSIDQVNAGLGGDTIEFSSGGTISLTSALPTIFRDVEIDATTATGYAGSPIVTLDGIGIGDPSANGLHFNSPSNGSTVRGMAIINMPFFGIRLTSVSSISIESNYIGTDGAFSAGNGVAGIGLYGSSSNTIGGVGKGNVISGNGGEGILLDGFGVDSNVIQGNYIGTNPAGNAAIGNFGNGITIDNGASNNVIGGDSGTGEGNLISGNGTGGYSGITIANSGSTNTLIYGNILGLNASQTNAIANGNMGVYIENGTGTTIGSATEGYGNVISGNDNHGIYVQNGDNTQIVANRIGTDETGMQQRGNGVSGIYLDSTDNATIGGATAAERNIIGDNGDHGIHLTGSDGNAVLGNFIGIGADGSSTIGNTDDGILIENGSINNVIGGDRNAGEGNLISGNGESGVSIEDATTSANSILGNRIGTNTLGNAARANGDSGVTVQNATGTIIGGTSEADRNLISGNSFRGITLLGANGGVIEGNYIGTNSDGDTSIQNFSDGIKIQSGSSNVRIGGAGSGNVISGNQHNGVEIDGSGTDNNTLIGNYIGTNADGDMPLDNGYDGIRIGNGASSNTIGGDSTAGEGNLLSGNNYNGIYINSGSTNGNTIVGNKIGTSLDGLLAIGNSLNGIEISNGSSNNVIGGTAIGAGNLISGNNDAGINLIDVATTGNTVLGNYIGTDVTGTNALPNFDGIYIGDAANNTIGGDQTVGEGNVISGNDDIGVYIEGTGSSNNVVAGNYIGTDASGSNSLQNGYVGIGITSGASNSLIGGSTDEGNVISGNFDHGVSIYGAGTGNVLSGNTIGLAADGDAILSNGEHGVAIRMTEQTLVGADGGSHIGNVISGNGGSGVWISGLSTSGTSDNTVAGNMIGTDKSGTLDRGNATHGVLVDAQAQDNVIGGKTVSERNTISGNSQDGVLLSGAGTDGNTILGNFIGTDSTGLIGLGNSDSGIEVRSGASNSILGGDQAAGAGNVISDNSYGVIIRNSSSIGNTIQGNYVGVDATGLAVLGNVFDGVLVSNGAVNTVIGGDASLGQGNVISGNGDEGIDIRSIGTDGTIVTGNFIGTDKNGVDSIGARGFANVDDGIVILTGADGTIIGGASAGLRNIISGNGGEGVNIDSSNGGTTTIRGNFIGLDASGDVALGNVGNGVRVESAPGTVIGGSAIGQGNTISANGGDGIQISGSTAVGTQILGNRIGTNADGTVDIGNTGAGIRVHNGANATLVGGDSSAGEGNLVSGNDAGGIIIDGSSGTDTVANLIYGNRVGTDENGIAALGNSGNGISVFGGAQDTDVGGDSSAGLGNLVSGQTSSIGISISDVATTGTVVQGNIVGSVADGSTALGNLDGVVSTDTVGTLIGGSGTGQANLVSGNVQDGIVVLGAASTGVQVIGNRVGTTANGLIANGNGRYGVFVNDDAQQVRIGGDTTAHANLLSGNTNGIAVGDATDVEIFGNLIGTDATGVATLANSDAGVIVFSSATNTLIGSTTAGTGNTISGNDSYGISVAGSGSGTVIAGNLVGLGSDGSTALGNSGIGVYIDTSNVTVGGNSAAAANTISANNQAGIWLTASGGNALIIGNVIGLDEGGTLDRGNAGFGIRVSLANGSIIGQVGAGNTISANSGLAGLYFTGSTGNTIVANRVGTSADGSTDIGNSGAGLVFDSTSTNNMVGGAAADANTIRANGGPGIEVSGVTATDNAILLNVISANGGLGIDLGLTGIQSNDNLDTDSGANDLQNYPVLSSVHTDGAGTAFIHGTIESTANTDYRIDYYASVAGDTSGHGEAERHLGTTLISTDSTGGATFSENLSVLVSIGEIVSATLTSLNGIGAPLSTSEFSANVIANANSAPVLDNSGVPNFTSVTEDESNNTGQTVASLLASAGNPISDVDADPEGIAVIDIDFSNDNGEFEYSIDSGASWVSFGIPNASQAVLLQDTDLIRFVPQGYGSETASIQFRAWDQSYGTAGSIVDVSTNGGMTAFSTALEIATITTTSINDAPIFGMPAGLSVEDFTDSFSSDTAVEVEVLADGSAIVIADGYYNGAEVWVLAKFTSDGVLDASFGTGGYVIEEFTAGNDSVSSLIVQPDGKILVSGDTTDVSNSDYALIRYNADGTRDNSFGTSGLFTFDSGGFDSVSDLAIQATGDILLLDVNAGDIVLLRVSGLDGTLDTGFGISGIGTIDLGASVSVEAMAVDASDRILVTGQQGNEAYVARITNSGILDTTFDVDGYVTTSLDGTDAKGTGVIVQSNGRIVIIGNSNDFSGLVDTAEEEAFGVARFTDAGVLDTSFGGDGIVRTVFTGSTSFGTGPKDIVEQTDGKLVVVGSMYFNTNAQDVWTLVRYNTDGSLDTSFGDDGVVADRLGRYFEHANSVGLESDGTIVVAGSVAYEYHDSAIARFDSNGVLITSNYSGRVNDTPTYTEDDVAVTLDTDVTVYDAELRTSDDFNGTRLTLVRNGGANNFDQFNGSGLLGALIEGNALTYDGVTIGVVTTNSGGTLRLDFTSGADNFTVNHSLRSIVYSNSSDSPAGSVQIDWTFDDGNAGVQGSGGAGQGVGSTVVTIIANNDAPVITSDGGGASAVVLANENQTTVTTVSSSDVDGGTPAYSISGGADAALFAINGTNGELTFQGAPDFELPSDSGANNIYDVTIQVSDGSGGTATQAIAVTVTNVNEDPVVTSAATVNTAENQTSVLTVASNDVDGGSPAYTISGGADAALFAINGTNGELTFQSAADFESPGDVGADNIYDVTVLVSDGNGGSATQTIAVSVTNVNEDPLITSAATANAAENQTSVLTVTSSDVDGGTPAYSISGGADAALFAINGTNGELTFQSAADFESPGDVGTDNTYDVTVQVTDGNGGTATQAIAVTVTNVNEDPLIASAATANAAENQTSVLTVTSSDVDGGTPAYSISGGADAALFAINGTNGELTFQSAADFESPGDVGADNIYDVTVLVSDGNGGSATQTIAVSVTNVNEDPLITSAATANAAENQTSVLTVTSSDVDGGTPAYSISGGADAALFAINGTNGELTFRSAADFESPGDVGADNIYDVTVLVSDGNGGSATQTIAVSVTNVNEDPLITSAATANAAENQTSVLTVTSSDVDGGTPAYSISGGADAALFAINGTNGELTFQSAPDFESPGDVGADNIYDVTVLVSDGNGGSATQAIAVTVTNVNEDPLINSAATANAAENQTSVLTVTSSDVDGGTPAYSISGGTDAALFAINGSSGELTFQSAPDFELPSDSGTNNIYDVTVQVADGNGGTATQAIVVTVTNVNEDPLITSANTVNAAENQTSVLTVTSSDVDGGTPAYSISGGADAALFAINGSSGELTFQSAPDFELPSDNGTDNTYNVTVQVSDGNGGSATQAIAVTLINVNEDPLITSANTVNATENQTSALTVTSSDVDGGTPAYSINGGADAALFAINGSSGVLTFQSTPDFESPGDVGTDNAYDVTVQVSDGNGGIATQAITVTVTNINEDPVITTVASANVTENQTSVLTVTSSDVDGGTPAYSISGGADAALFAINSSSGALTFQSAPDFESPGDVGTDNTYDVTVRVSDGNGGTATQTIAVTVTNVNEDPLITSANTVNAAENQTGVLTVTSSDVDGGTPVYSISGGADAAVFAINGSSGELTFQSAPDIENPGDVGADNIYDVTVQVSDGNGGTATQAIAVTVTNVNEDPLITSATIASAAENLTSVLTVTSFDVDGGTPAYSISGGADAALFAINGSSGALTFQSAPDFESPGDVGTDNTYDVTVQVADGNGGTATQAIAVTVTNVNEDPLITSATIASAAENQTSVLTVTSSDVDGGTPAYSISGGADAALFAINGASGELMFQSAPDFELPSDSGTNNTYDVTVQVADGNGGTATQAIAVTVTNVNEDPLITSATIASAAENQTSVLTVTSLDVDGGTPAYSISGGTDAALFAVNGVSGELTFQSAPDFESPGDVGTDNTYDVTVQVADGNGGTATQAIAVTVTNVNEDPLISSANTVSAAENQTSVLTITSFDVDGGTPAYSISGGADAALFAINGASGELTFQSAPDFELPSDSGTNNIYDVTVQVADENGGTATQAIVVTVTNVNEDPLITSTNTVNAAENQTSVLTVTSFDVDGGTPAYSISGGADAALFAINGASGELIFQSAPDFELPSDNGTNNTYDVTVQVADGNGGTATQAIAVTVTNVNEDPLITSAATANAAENQTSVLTVTSSDVDGGTPAYSISGGADAALFAINGASGELTFQSAPDFELPSDSGTNNTYDVTVQVADGNGGTATQAIAVAVTNVNEDPLITSATIASAAENQTSVLTVTSFDVDGGTPAYSITGGADAALFAINGASGELTFQSVPDFESPGDVGTDNTYDVTVQVADGNGGTATQAIAVTVTNVNEDPLITSANKLNALENQSSVLTVISSDVDGGTPAYSISGGADAALFAINGSSGVLTFQSTPNFESPGDVGADNIYDVTVLVSDGNGGSATQAIAVTVTNVNEDPLITSAATSTAVENQRSALTVTSSDVDGGAPVYSISGGADVALFSINGSSGVLTFQSAPDFESPGDVGANNIYEVTIQVADGNGGTATQAIAVTVTNVNEDPLITSANTVSAAENQTSVLTVTSSDVDGGIPVYSISGGADTALFSINGSSGELTFQSAPDLESPGDVGLDNIYDVTVQVADGNGGAATQAITVTVVNVNEDPVITSTASMGVAENQTSVLTITSSDADGGTSAYSISGGADAALFAINGSSGALTFQSAPDFESPGDVGANNIYDVTVQVVDGNGGSATQAIAVTVTNVNEDPVITSAATATAFENQTSVLTVTSSDVDGGTPVYSITGGVDAAVFAINGSSGELTFQSAPNIEIPGDVGTNNVYDVTVQVLDGNGGTATQRIAVTVTNVNENPLITSASSVNAAENQTSVLTITSSDVDGGTLVYSIVGGDDADSFSINESNGELAFQTAPDFESPGDLNTDNVYEVMIQVADGNGGLAAELITVNVTNTNEVPSSSADILVAREDTLLVIDPVIELLTNDIDPEGGELRLESFEQPENGMLVQNTEGMLEYRPDANFNGVDRFDYTVSDTAGNSASTSVLLNVEAVNDAPGLSSGPVDGSEEIPGLINALTVSSGPIQVAENAGVVGLVAANDVDGDVLNFTLAGPDAALFEIDSSSGVISPLVPLDFEVPRDADGNNSYDLHILITDQFNEVSSVPVSITAIDVNEPPALIQEVFTLEEGFTGTLGQLTGFDPDTGDELVFELVSAGANDSIDGLILFSDGRLTAAELAPGSYELEVLVRDASGLSSIGRVVINVQSKSEPPLGSAITDEQVPDLEVTTVSGNLEPQAITANPTLIEPASDHRELVAVVVMDREFSEDISMEMILMNDRETLPPQPENPPAKPAFRLDHSIAKSQEEAVSPILSTAYSDLPTSPQMLLDLMDRIRSSLADLNEQEETTERRLTLTVAFGGVIFSIGFASWLLSSRILLAAALSTVSLWRPIDPIPVLLGGSRPDDDLEKNVIEEKELKARFSTGEPPNG